MEQREVLIIGYGRLGRRVAAHLQAAGYSVCAVRRSAGESDTAIRMVCADVTKPDTLNCITARRWCAVFIALTADSFDAESYQRSYVDGLRNVIAALPASMGAESPLLFASSTSVYSQHNGEWVDENSATEPTGFSGKTMLAAESLLSNSPLTGCALRYGGLYGGNTRHRLLERCANGDLCARTPTVYSNRMHIDDAAALAAHLIKWHHSGGELANCYIGVDNDPAPLYDVMTWLARQLGAEATTDNETAKTSRPRGANKRCSNALIHSTGFRLTYPDYKSGYGSILRKSRLQTQTPQQ